jgi:hypothetical protein
LTQDGGASWSQVTDWRAERGTQNYAHADQHGLVMPPGEPGRVYAVNDGGVDVSRDGGRTWANRSAGLAITMFYDFDVAQSDPGFFGGGTQDNGSNVTLEGKADKYIDVTGGDGGWLVIDPGDANHFIASIYNGFIFRWTGRWEEIPLPLTEAERERVWMVFIAMDRQDPLTLVTGTDRVWRTNDGGKVWTAVSNVLDGSLVSSVAIAPSESARIYVGTENGGIFRSVDRGDNWSGNLAGAVVPSFLITRLTVHQTSPSIVYATVANSGHSHVYRSVDGGDTWQDVDRGKLPDIAHNACVIDPDDSTTLYVANDVGVFMSVDEGGSWTSVSANLPRVPVTDLVLHQQTRRLFAATYGRSAYGLQLDVQPSGRARRQQPRRRSPRRRARK